MTEGPRPGSRSERHQPRRSRRQRATAAKPDAVVPGPLETLRPTAARSSRRADMRRRRRRWRTKVVAGAVALLAITAGGIAVMAYRDDDPGSSVTPPKAQRTQRTLLLQVPTAEGNAAASALLVTDARSDSAAVVLVPSRVITVVPGHGTAVFGDALGLGGPKLSRETLANRLDVIVDDAWMLEPTALAGLVESVGGIDVTVDVELPGGPESSNVQLSEGQQHLGGQAAAAFATYSAPGQPELSRLARLQLVLVGILDALPKTAEEVAPLVPTTEVDTGGASAETIAESLRLLAAARVAQKLTYKTIPVVDIDNGSDEETTRIDDALMPPLVTEVLAASVPPNDFRPSNRVLVRNGVGTAAIGQSVTQRLNAAGFTVTKTENADNFDYERTQVLIFDGGDRAVSLGDKVAAALGLADDAVEVAEIEQDAVDVIVTVGADYAAEGTAAPSVGP